MQRLRSFCSNGARWSSSCYCPGDSGLFMILHTLCDPDAAVLWSFLRMSTTLQKPRPHCIPEDDMECFSSPIFSSWFFVIKSRCSVKLQLVGERSTKGRFGEIGEEVDGVVHCLENSFPVRSAIPLYNITNPCMNNFKHKLRAFRRTQLILIAGIHAAWTSTIWPNQHNGQFGENGFYSFRIGIVWIRWSFQFPFPCSSLQIYQECYFGLNLNVYQNVKCKKYFLILFWRIPYSKLCPIFNPFGLTQRRFISQLSFRFIPL